jgi:ATP-binding cassette subfamily C protein
LGFLAASGEPVALLPAANQSYEMVNPAQDSRTRLIKKEQLSQLAAQAFCFYRPFPERAVRSMDVVKFGLQGSRKDLLIALMLGVGGGLLAMLVPIVTGQLFDAVIPTGAQGQLMQFFAGLVVAALAAAAFQLVRGIALLRVESRLDISVQAALWDRLLNLPVTFFRRHSSGDLAERAMGINYIRRLISGSVITAIISSIFSLFSFGLLFSYNVGLALVATGLSLTMLGVTLGFSYWQLRYQRRITNIEGKLSGIVLELITGIAKLRVAGAELRAFAVWGKHFSQQKKVAFKAQSINNYLAVFKVAWPIVTTMVIFAVVSSSHNLNLTTGTFLAFNAAFAQFLVAIVGLMAAFDAILQAITIFERAAPILESVPEVDTAKTTPGQLSGAIEINQVSFRYNADSPLILNGLSMKIEPGQFVAIVGPSGAGKSSLLRLLLGFDNSEAGSIYYDGQDLSGLNMQAVRRQIGVVIQNSQLMPGGIIENIIGNTNLTMEDAWDAARKAGLASDIEQMPMGMFTMISEGGGGLSGGQRQRLMIARAIANKPRILLFDEATSALDNRTQAIVSASLENLQATRIVIAHRLSTIIYADRIFVLQGGKFVQEGTYDELMSQAGPFRDLATRQLA